MSISLSPMMWPDLLNMQDWAPGELQNFGYECIFQAASWFVIAYVVWGICLGVYRGINRDHCVLAMSLILVSSDLSPFGQHPWPKTSW